VIEGTTFTGNNDHSDSSRTESGGPYSLEHPRAAGGGEVRRRAAGAGWEEA